MPWPRGQRVPRTGLRRRRLAAGAGPARLAAPPRCSSPALLALYPNFPNCIVPQAVESPVLRPVAPGEDARGVAKALDRQLQSEAGSGRGILFFLFYFSLFPPTPQHCECCCWALVALGRLKSSVYARRWRGRSSSCPGFPLGPALSCARARRAPRPPQADLCRVLSPVPRGHTRWHTWNVAGGARTALQRGAAGVGAFSSWRTAEFCF